MGKAKLNIPMFAALILLLLTMVTTHMTSGLYARYTASATASDSARVAKFDVTGDVTGAGNVYYLTVNNNSEVAVEYSVVVQMHPKLSVTIGEETKTLKDDETSVTFENDDWKLAPNANSEPIAMTFAVADWSGLTKSTDNGEQVTVNLDFAVKVTAVQID